ncbi:MAG: hypothetical protein NXI24_10435 [bacterium]|nr:hypothetical protein [bacterium]
MARSFAVALVAALLLANGVDLQARDRSPGRPYFEQAYEAEQETPADAIALYRRAISAGLKPELVRAARWRLFYLYRQAGEYGEALDVAAHLGSDRKLKNVLGDIYKEIAVIYKVPESSAREYALGLKQLARKRESASVAHFEKALRANRDNEALRAAITNQLMRRGHSGTALVLLKKLGYDIHKGEKERNGGAELARADLLVKLKRDAEAEEVLFALARSAAGRKLKSAERSHLLYLLARTARRAKDREAVVRWFRLAAVEAAEADEEELQSRMQGLAAYELYRAGRQLQARALLYGIPETEDANVNLLSLVLRVEVDDDAAARKKLRAMKNELLAGRQSYLTRAALRVAEGRRDSPRTKPEPAAEPKKTKPKTRESKSKDGEASRPDPEEFWQRSFRKTFGRRIKIEVPENYGAYLVRNPDRLQFHGASRIQDRLTPRLAAPLEIPDDLENAGELFQRLRGDFVLAFAPIRKAEDLEHKDSESNSKQSETKNKTPAPVDLDPLKELRLAQVTESRTFGDQDWVILGIHSDGEGGLWVELEAEGDRSSMPGFARGRVAGIDIEFLGRGD